MVVPGVEREGLDRQQTGIGLPLSLSFVALQTLVCSTTSFHSSFIFHLPASSFPRSFSLVFLCTPLGANIFFHSFYLSQPLQLLEFYCEDDNTNQNLHADSSILNSCWIATPFDLKSGSFFLPLFLEHMFHLSRLPLVLLLSYFLFIIQWYYTSSLINFIWNGVQ